MSDIDEWRAYLAQLAPATTVGADYDLPAAIYRAYDEGRIAPMQIHTRDTSDRSPRTYLGASLLGEPCARRVWADWRGDWQPDGRLRRLFATGDITEARVVAELRSIGLDYRPDTRGFVALDGRVRGHTDGFIDHGHRRAVVEIKSCNKKRFRELERLKYDLPAWDERYAGQVHLYLTAHDLTTALYVVSCKDDERIAAWLIERDDEIAGAAIARAHEVLRAINVAPSRAYRRPVQPTCSSFCSHSDWCWYEGEIPRTCGSCQHWRPGRVCALTGASAESTCDDYLAVEHGGGQISWTDL